MKKSCILVAFSQPVCSALLFPVQFFIPKSGTEVPFKIEDSLLSEGVVHLSLLQLVLDFLEGLSRFHREIKLQQRAILSRRSSQRKREGSFHPRRIESRKPSFPIHRLSNLKVLFASFFHREKACQDRPVSLSHSRKYFTFVWEKKWYSLRFELLCLVCIGPFQMPCCRPRRGDFL